MFVELVQNTVLYRNSTACKGSECVAASVAEGPRPLPGRQDLLVLQLLHPGGGGHRHGDHDVVDVEGALAAAPLDGLLLAHKTSVSFTSGASNSDDCDSVKT